MGGIGKRGYLLGGNVCAKEIGKRQKNYEKKGKKILWKCRLQHCYFGKLQCLDDIGLWIFNGGIEGEEEKEYFYEIKKTNNILFYYF